MTHRSPHSSTLSARLPYSSSRRMSSSSPSSSSWKLRSITRIMHCLHPLSSSPPPASESRQPVLQTFSPLESNERVNPSRTGITNGDICRRTLVKMMSDHIFPRFFFAKERASKLFFCMENGRRQVCCWTFDTFCYFCIFIRKAHKRSRWHSACAVVLPSIRCLRQFL